MTFIRSGIALLAVFVAGIAGTAAASTPHDHCARRGWTVVDASSTIALYLSENSSYWACAGRLRPLYLTNAGDPDDLVEDVGVAGSYVGYARVYCDRYEQDAGCSTSVALWNVRRRMKVMRGTRLPGSGGVAGFGLSPSGAMALILRRHDRFGIPTRVVEVDRGGFRVIDEGNEIQEDSLAVSRGHVYWLRGQQAESATLD